MAKRKRDGEASSKPSKKVVIDAPPPCAKVSSFLQPKSSPPVIVATPGVQVPNNLSFHSYAPQSKSKKTMNAAQEELLLHSTSHPTLDYTVKEDIVRGTKPKLNHFVGIYDPKTGKMQVVEAKKMTVRGAVRSKQAAETEAAEKKMGQTMFDRKSELGQIFGTKKARKAIQDVTLNAISPQKKSANGESSAVTMDAASKAMLGSVGKVTSTMATREELQAAVDEAKPVPRPNLEAEDIEDVYDPRAIIGADVLNLVPIREWQEKAEHGDNISTSSRFVAKRVVRVATNKTPEGVLRLRVLRYFYFVLLFYLSSKPGRERGTRSVLARDKLREALQPAPEAVVENIRRKFSDGGVMRKFHLDLIKTHCCAFACMVDNFEVDTQDLRDDLKLDQKEVNQLFHEIGGRAKPVKRDGRTVHVARLALPLNFPKQRHLAPKRR